MKRKNYLRLLFVLPFAGCLFACGVDDTSNASATTGTGTGTDETNTAANDTDASTGDDSDSGTSETTGDSCFPMAHLEGDECVCDPGYALGSSCDACVVDPDEDGCNIDQYPQGTGCTCVLGLESDRACGCEPSGEVGSPCTSDFDCVGQLNYCVTSMSMFSAVSAADVEYSAVGALPGGYCAALTSPSACSQAFGTWIEVDWTGGGAHLCLRSCAADEECRSGYECRPMGDGDFEREGEPFPASEFDVVPDGYFCLP